MKQILVSGAGGYIGIPLCKTLLDSGYKVIALDRYYFGREKMKGILNDPNLNVIQNDIRYIDESIFEDVDGVIDLAGLSNDASAEIDPQLTIDINRNGAAHFAGTAQKHGIRRYVYSSSASVYGAGTKESLVETDSLSPQTEYAQSKVSMEKTLQNLQSDAFETVILRNSTVFGLAPRMRFDLAINVMTMRAWKERVIYVMGGGEQWRPFVHVQDVVQAMILALEAPTKKVSGQIFNVGSSGNNYKIKQLAQFVVDAIPNVKIHTIPDDADKRSYNVNFDKILNVLAFKPEVSILDGIQEILHALEKGVVDPDDPTSYTLQWYKSLMTWAHRINELSCNGKII
jgi:nucleoside-diphosphate-sugar epimerase